MTDVIIKITCYAPTFSVLPFLAISTCALTPDTHDTRIRPLQNNDWTDRKRTLRQGHETTKTYCHNVTESAEAGGDPNTSTKILRVTRDLKIHRQIQVKVKVTLKEAEGPKGRGVGL